MFLNILFIHIYNNGIKGVLGLGDGALLWTWVQNNKKGKKRTNSKGKCSATYSPGLGYKKNKKTVYE